MADGKIQVGYGSDQRGSTKKGLYGTRSSEKNMMNGGFNFAPTVTFTNISADTWYNIFGEKSPNIDRDVKVKE